MADALLEVDGLEAGYGEVQVLWGLSLKARRGALTAIVGANGAGKTTTLRAVAGTIAPWRGRVLFEGEDVTRLPTHAKAARGFALVPEGRQLFSAMSVAENLQMGAFAKRAAAKYADRLDQVFSLFPRLKERARQQAGTLSGGEQQMVAIARGLMSDPDILIIDELSLGLAPVVVYQLLTTLKRAEGSRPHHSARRAERASGFGAERLCLRRRRGAHLHGRACRRSLRRSRRYARRIWGCERRIGFASLYLALRCKSFPRFQIDFRLRSHRVSKPLRSNVSRQQGRCINDLQGLTSSNSATAFDIRPYIRLKPKHLAHRRAHSGCDPEGGVRAVPAGGLANRSRAASGIMSAGITAGARGAAAGLGQASAGNAR